jgi:predicted XRE-type DNA-binding protein
MFSRMSGSPTQMATGKAELTSKIAGIIEALDLTQSQVAERTGLAQPKVSILLRGNSKESLWKNFSGFSLHSAVM